MAKKNKKPLFNYTSPIGRGFNTRSWQGKLIILTFVLLITVAIVVASTFHSLLLALVSLIALALIFGKIIAARTH